MQALTFLLAVALLGAACASDRSLASRYPPPKDPGGAFIDDGVPLKREPEFARFEAIYADWVERRATLEPNWATRIGKHQHDERLTRYDDASVTARRALAEELYLRLCFVESELFSPGQRVDWRLALAQAEVALREFERHDERADTPGLILDAITAINDLVLSDHGTPAERRAHIVARLEQLPLVCAELRGKLDRPPRLWTEQALVEIDGALVFLADLPALQAIRDGNGEMLVQAAADAHDALADFREFLSDEVLPRSDGDFAVGRETYEFLLQRGRLVDMSAQQLSAFGTGELHLVLGEMKMMCTLLGWGDWKTVLAEMMAKHPPPHRLMSVYKEECAKARQFLIDHDLVGIPPEELQIVETPEFQRSSTPFAAYLSPPPLDESRLGTFFVTPVPEAHIDADIPGTVWHEAYPGHHLQLVYAKDNASLVRQLNDSPLLSEGWGLYCEELAHETGYFDDPHERLMQLNWRLQRAARVILDVELHAFGFSFEHAVAFLEREVGMGHEQAVASAYAYTRQPTYFPCYTLGFREILRLREDCRQRLGERFTLREFHERLLRAGNVPPALLRDELAEWR